MGWKMTLGGLLVDMLTISIPQPIITGIFDECDRYPKEETGGRFVGFYKWRGTDLHIDVKAVIAAGPNAQRTSVSLFQDGEYQERMFRLAEKQYPNIEHLGSWHSHHANGLRTLSQGDVQTYRKSVNSPNHNTDFFYALLVTHQTPEERERYAIKHFVFVRHAVDFVEVDPQDVQMENARVLGVAG